MVQIAYCDLLHTFHKQVTNVSQHVFVILLWGILMSPLRCSQHDLESLVEYGPNSFLSFTGNIPRQLCKSTNIRKLLPSSTSSTLLGTRPKSRSPFQDVNKTEGNAHAAKKALTTEVRERIFELLHDINSWEEVLILLQVCFYFALFKLS